MRNLAECIVVVLLLAVLMFFGMTVEAGDKERKSFRHYVVATAYCPCEECCGEHADGRTATGRDAYKAGVAVDPKHFPLGTRFDIPGYERGPNGNGSWVLADDTGEDINGMKIDVRFRTHREAKKWGKKRIKIRVWYP